MLVELTDKTKQLYLYCISIISLVEPDEFLKHLFNSFHVCGLFLYPLNSSENQKFSNLFKGV